MSIKAIDTFISNSVQLFEVNPSQTIFSISYKWKPKSSKKKPVVSFKAHNPHLSNHYKFKTNKSKDVSRLLSALGPRGVTITRGRIEKRVSKQEGSVKKSKKEVKSRDVVGLSTLMVNTEVKEYVPVVEEKSVAAESSSKKKKSKNKGKKRR